MKRVKVNCAGSSYIVDVGVSYVDATVDYVKGLDCAGKVFIVSDTNVFPLHGEALVNGLKNEGYTVRNHLIKAGEESKNLGTVNKIYEQLYDFGITRDDIILAFGGGVVGDITGFAAGTYLRGIRYIQIPTTLLAQVDSSVGGKTGVDTEHGKNQIGMFYQPSAVVIDVNLLSTLSKVDFNDGMAEVIKYSLIKDKELISLIKEISNERNLEQLIYKCLKIKGEIVSKDEKDKGERMLLNFGHTFGHGIEKCGNFTKYTHGSAVAMGMVMAAQLGERIGITKEGTSEEVIDLCKLFDLPTETEEDLDEILDNIQTDKKISGGIINFIILKSVGESEIHPIHFAQLHDLMSDQIIIKPKALIGKLKSVPSKSFLHRALICSALSNGKSRIGNIIYSEDIKATLNALKALGVKIKEKDDYIEVKGIFDDNKICINEGIIKINCKESGSTLRFIMPVIAALGLSAELSGTGRLPLRPISTYLNIFDSSEITYSHPDGKFLPLNMKGKLSSGDYKMSGGVSSQYISGLMMALPICKGNSTLEILPPFESRGYVDITISVMKAFGIKVREEINAKNNSTKFTIFGNQNYSKTDYEIEGDWSQAAPWLCAGAINGKVEITGLNVNSLQGDIAIIDILTRFGAKVKIGEKSVTVSKGELKGINIDAGQIPDIIPVVSAVAALALGKTNIQNCGRLRFKESDRLETTAELLSKLGADVKIECDSLVINGIRTLKGGEVESYKDHRIVMAASVAALLCEKDVIIKGYHAINKSYPKYFQDYKHLGGETDGINIR